MTAVFVVSAALQWNDPDPAYWMAVYDVSAILAARAVQGQLPLVPNLVAAGDELAREAGGLGVCALWSGLQPALARRARPH
jgi:hypothetical protein